MMSSLMEQYGLSVLGLGAASLFFGSCTVTDDISKNWRKLWMVFGISTGAVAGGGFALIAVDEFMPPKSFVPPAMNCPVPAAPPPASAPGGVPENTGKAHHAIFYMEKPTSTPPVSQSGCAFTL